MLACIMGSDAQKGYEAAIVIGMGSAKHERRYIATLSLGSQRVHPGSM